MILTIMKVNFCKHGFYLEVMGGMVNCKNFSEILYLIKINANTTIIYVTERSDGNQTWGEINEFHLISS